MKMEQFHIKNGDEELSESEKLGRAEKYWELRLKGEERIAVPQRKKCEFSIVVPVYGENIERLKKQIDSIKNQSTDPDKYEIIYIVNNDVPTDNQAGQTIVEQNQKLINLLSADYKDLPIFIIDKSSTGHEIPGCNVGKARNRGVAEASIRFYENGKDGLIIQTDADTYFEDRNYLKKIQGALEKSPDVIGVAGGLIFEFDPDTANVEEKQRMERKIDIFIKQKKLKIMEKFLKKGEVYSPLRDATFSGANMISKSLESAIIGGLTDVASGEDPRFGNDLAKYAEHNHGRVIGMKDELKVVTALRDSDRTPSSFKKAFDQIDPDEPSFLIDNIIKEKEKLISERKGGKELLESIEKMIQQVRMAD